MKTRKRKSFGEFTQPKVTRRELGFCLKISFHFPKVTKSVTFRKRPKMPLFGSVKPKTR